MYTGTVHTDRHRAQALVPYLLRRHTLLELMILWGVLTHMVYSVLLSYPQIDGNYCYLAYIRSIHPRSWPLHWSYSDPAHYR